MYINDMNANLFNSRVLLYVEDTVVYARNKDEGLAHLKRGTKLVTVILDYKLQYVNHFNYLGVKLKENLSFELHATDMRMVAHKLNLLARIRKYITTSQALTIYKTKIVPYFDYGDIFLMNISHKTVDKLQRLQNRELRFSQAQGGSWVTGYTIP